MVAYNKLLFWLILISLFHMSVAIFGPDAKVPNKCTIKRLDCNRRSATVTWKNGNDGIRMKFYLLQYNTTYEPNRWLTFAEVPGNMNQYTVTMYPWTWYNFRVIAVNEVGQSEPSDMTIKRCYSPHGPPPKNPDNVTAVVDKDDNLIIRWNRLRPIEQGAPQLKYHVFYRRDYRGYVYKKMVIGDWLSGKVTIPDQSKNYNYRVKVLALNSYGEAEQVPMTSFTKKKPAEPGWKPNFVWQVTDKNEVNTTVKIEVIRSHFRYDENFFVYQIDYREIGEDVFKTTPFALLHRETFLRLANGRFYTARLVTMDGEYYVESEFKIIPIGHYIEPNTTSTTTMKPTTTKAKMYTTTTSMPSTTTTVFTTTAPPQATTTTKRPTTTTKMILTTTTGRTTTTKKPTTLTTDHEIPKLELEEMFDKIFATTDVPLRTTKKPTIVTTTTQKPTETTTVVTTTAPPKTTTTTKKPTTTKKGILTTTTTKIPTTMTTEYESPKLELEESSNKIFTTTDIPLTTTEPPTTTTERETTTMKIRFSIRPKVTTTATPKILNRDKKSKTTTTETPFFTTNLPSTYVQKKFGNFVINNIHKRSTTTEEPLPTLPSFNKNDDLETSKQDSKNQMILDNNDVLTIIFFILICIALILAISLIVIFARNCSTLDCCYTGYEAPSGAYMPTIERGVTPTGGSVLDMTSDICDYPPPPPLTDVTNPYTDQLQTVTVIQPATEITSFRPMPDQNQPSANAQPAVEMSTLQRRRLPSFDEIKSCDELATRHVTNIPPAQPVPKGILQTSIHNTLERNKRQGTLKKNNSIKWSDEEKAELLGILPAPSNRENRPPVPPKKIPLILPTPVNQGNRIPVPPPMPIIDTSKYCLPPFPSVIPETRAIRVQETLQNQISRVTLAPHEQLYCYAGADQSQTCVSTVPMTDANLPDVPRSTMIAIPAPKDGQPRSRLPLVLEYSQEVGLPVHETML